MAARDWVFEVGDRVKTWGRFVGGADGDWLDLARVHSPISRPPGWKSDRSVRLIGAALPTGSVPNQHPSYLSVVGIWRDERIEVEALSQEIPLREPPRGVREPPCPPPDGGWRREVPIAVDFESLESSGAMVTRAIFRPYENVEVLVIAATDVDAVTRELSPMLPHQLCVVPSRYTPAQLDELRDVLHAKWWEWRLEVFGIGTDAQAQPYIRAQPFRVTSEMAEWADALPEGLIRLDPVLRPA